MVEDELELSKRDSIEFVKALLNDTEPNEALKEAARQYKENKGGGRDLPFDVRDSYEAQGAALKSRLDHGGE